MKKVFLGPIDLGLNQIFKEKMLIHGYNVTTCSFVEHKNYGFQDDINLKINKVNICVAALRVLVNFFKSLNYDFYHFKFGQSLLPFNLDLPLLRLMGKKIIMSWHGQDLRQWDRFQADPYNKILSQKIGFSQFNEWRKRCRFNFIKLFVQKMTVSTPDLLEFAPQALFVPEMAPLNRILSSKLKAQDSKTGIVIFHAPSNRAIKGTEYVIKAVDRLKSEGEKVKLVLSENLSAQQIADSYQNTDLVIDQLLIGTYGVVAVEAMLSQKPVICYIREDLKDKYPADLPIINANPDNIYDILKATIKRTDLIKLGEKSFKFILNFHSPEKLAQKWAKIYGQL